MYYDFATAGSIRFRRFFRRAAPEEKFDLEAKILGFVDCGDSIDPEGGSSTFYVVIRDGTIYNVTLAWPQLTVQNITILNQTRPVEDMP